MNKLRIFTATVLLSAFPVLGNVSAQGAFDLPPPPSQLPNLNGGGNSGSLPAPPPLPGQSGQTTQQNTQGLPFEVDTTSGALPSQRNNGNSPAGQIVPQSQGQYPILERSPTLPLGAIQRAWDAPYSSLGQISPGVVRYAWRPDNVMAIRTREFIMTTIHLPSFENIKSVVVGDPVIFKAQQISGNVFGVRPNHSGADSNITVLGTSGNVYSFYVRSEGYNTDQISDITVYVEAESPGGVGGVSSITPGFASGSGGFPAGYNGQDINTLSTALSSSINGGPSSAPDYIRKIAFRPDALNFDMTILAPTPEDTAIAPLRVFNDGVWTYFDFGDKVDSMRRPVVFLVEDDVDTMINTRTVGPKGNILIAEAMGDFTLRNGNRVICVYRNSTLRYREDPDLLLQKANGFKVNPDQLRVVPSQDIHSQGFDPEKSVETNGGFLDNVSSWFE